MGRCGAAVIAASLVATVATGAVAAAAAAERADDEAAPDRRPFWDRVGHPNRARYEALITEANRAEGAQRLPDAAKALERAAALEPEEPAAHYYLGNVRLNLRDWQGCADSMARVLELDPDFDPPNQHIQSVALELGTCQLQAGRWEDAIVTLRRALVSPREPRDQFKIWWALGDAAMQLGRLDDAISGYREAIKGRGGSPALLNLLLGVALDRAGDHAAALVAARSSLNYDPGADLFHVLWVLPEEEHYARGLAHEVAGRRARARFHFRTFVAMTKTSPWLRRARVHLGLLEGAPSAGDIVLPRATAPVDAGPIVKAVLAGAPALSRCLDGHTATLWRVDFSLPPLSGAAVRPGLPSAPAPVQRPPKVDLMGGVDDAARSPRGCLQQAAAAVKLPRVRQGSIAVGSVLLWITAP